MGSVINAIQQVLTEAGEPLHYKEITRRILAGGLWQTDGKTPEATVSAQLAVHIKNRGEKARFRRVGSGVFALTGVAPTADSGAAVTPPPFEIAGPLSFTDAAERVLTRLGAGQPLHYRDVTDKALELGLIRTSGRTPEATMYASVLEEIKRYRRRGEQPRFHMHGKGMIGLAKELPTGIPAQVEQHNRKVREQLHACLMSMSFGEFEDLVGDLLGRMGFAEVSVTQRQADKGIDVRGTLVVSDSVRIRMAVQVKRWANNVQAPTVQRVRGSLGAHEQGLIITTSDFSPGCTKGSNPRRRCSCRTDERRAVAQLAV